MWHMNLIFRRVFLYLVAHALFSYIRWPRIHTPSFICITNPSCLIHNSLFKCVVQFSIGIILYFLVQDWTSVVAENQLLNANVFSTNWSEVTRVETVVNCSLEDLGLLVFNWYFKLPTIVRLMNISCRFIANKAFLSWAQFIFDLYWTLTKMIRSWLFNISTRPSLLDSKRRWRSHIQLIIIYWICCNMVWFIGNSLLIWVCHCYISTWSCLILENRIT